MTYTNKEKVEQWIIAAGIRAIRTAAQVALGCITVGVAVSEIDWVYVASIAIVAAIYSVLNSVAGIPEVNDGASLPEMVKE